MLNGKQLKEYITNCNFDSHNIQQVGIDLNVLFISFIKSKGSILREKTILPEYEALPVTCQIIGEGINKTSREGWLLAPGMYDVIFAQGCRVPHNACFFIRQRSSMLRIGAMLHSSVFDPGFETERLGSCIEVFSNEVFIEYGARIAQIYGHECSPVDNNDLYRGQWQNDKQRT